MPFAAPSRVSDRENGGAVPAHVQAAALQANTTVNTKRGGAYFGFNGDTGTELPLEFGLTLHNPAGDVVGDVRLGGYFDTSNVFGYASRESQYAISGRSSNAAALATLPAQYVRGRRGAYVQLDHLIEGSSAVDKRGTAIFLNSEYSDPNSALISSFLDAGIARHGTLRSRPKDTVSLGFSTENFNPRLQKLQLALQAAGYNVPYNGSEQAFEFNYGWQASQWLLVRPRNAVRSKSERRRNERSKRFRTSKERARLRPYDGDIVLSLRASARFTPCKSR